MPGPSARSQQPRDSSSQHHILADATVLAEALGCANTPDAVVVSLKQLAAEATLRYGMPLTARSRLEPALMLPDTEIIPFEIKLSIETPWKRLAEALRLPAIGELAIMAQLSVSSPTQIPVLIEGIGKLRTELATFLQIPEDLGSKMMPLRPTLSRCVNESPDSGPVGDILMHVHRQLRVLDQAGPEYTRVTQQELNLMHAMLRSFNEESAQRQKSPSIANQDIASVGMSWRWKEERSQFEPILNVQSRYTNSTLFDLSSHYFEAVLKRQLEGGSIKNPKAKLLRDLGDLRSKFERDDNEIALRDGQQRLFASFKRPVD